MIARKFMEMPSCAFDIVQRPESVRIIRNSNSTAYLPVQPMYGRCGHMAKDEIAI